MDEFYKNFTAKTYNGYRVTAIDGITLNLPYHEESISEFKIQKSTGGQIQALGSCLYDVLNEIIIDADIGSYDASEREFAVCHLERLAAIPNGKELVILDRGYPSRSLIKAIEDMGFKYLIRCSSSFVQGMRRKITSDDCIVLHKFYGDTHDFRFRVVTVTLQSGESEYLITNIFDEFTKDNFYELYHLRWEIETNYNDIKNKLNIESFSGATPIAIKQEFYATTFLRNLASMMILENADQVDELQNSKGNKYEYKANTNAVISVLKIDLIKLFVTDSERKKRTLWKKIYRELSNAVIPIRPGRSFPRRRKHKVW